MNISVDFSAVVCYMSVFLCVKLLSVVTVTVFRLLFSLMCAFQYAAINLQRGHHCKVIFVDSSRKNRRIVCGDAYASFFTCMHICSIVTIRVNAYELVLCRLTPNNLNLAAVTC